MISFDYIFRGLAGSAIIGTGISYGDLYLFHIMIAIFLFFLLISFKQNSFKIKFEHNSIQYIYFFPLFFLWYSISLIWSPDLSFGLKYLFYIFCGSILSLSIIYFCSDYNNLYKMFRTIKALIVLEIAISILEIFTQFRMPISPYSNYFTFFGKESIEINSPDLLSQISSFNPPTGFHWNTNNLAITMILALPFFLCTNNTFSKIAGTLCITIITIFTSSRAVFLALVLIFLFYLISIKKRIPTLSFISVFLVIILFGASMLTESDNPRLNEIANSFEALRLYIVGDIDLTGSLEWRRNLIIDGVSSLKESYGIGVGAGGSTALQESSGGVAGRFTSMHNFWIEVLVEGGIIFGILSSIWYLKILYGLYLLSRQRRSELEYFSQALYLSMLGFIPAAIAASSTIYFLPMYILFGLSVSVVSLGKRSLN